MARLVGTHVGEGRPLDNDEAARLINIILDNTPASAPARPQTTEGPKSLSDIFPVSVLAAA